MRLVDAAAKLRDATRPLAVDAPYVCHPLDYAWRPHEQYLRRYGQAQGRVVLVGMNPGPWGMGQTGVPFADPGWARDWMGIEADVEPVAGAHPARPILGFASTRPDPSGAKLYGWARARFGTAQRFFAGFFVTNWCPLLLLDDAGRNIPIDALGKEDRALVSPPCDAWMLEAVGALRPRLVVALGRFVHARLDALALDVPLRQARHPSPANPLNNAGWGEELEDLATEGASGASGATGAKGRRRAS